MEQKMCPITGELWDTGNLLVAKNTKEELDMYTCTGYAYSPKVEEMFEKEYCALVEMDEEATKEKLKSKVLDDGKVTMLDAVRTGRVMYIKKELAINLFGEGVKEMNFIDEETFELLKKKQEDVSITKEEKTTRDGES